MPRELTIFMHCLPEKRETAANDNCFWRWLMGPYPPFDTANDIRRKLDRFRAGPGFGVEERIELVEHCKVFLALFEAVVIDGDTKRAEALAPRLNRCIPWLMQHCPDEALRPKPEEVWYPPPREEA